MEFPPYSGISFFFHERKKNWVKHIDLKSGALKEWKPHWNLIKSTLLFWAYDEMSAKSISTFIVIQIEIVMNFLIRCILSIRSDFLFAFQINMQRRLTRIDVNGENKSERNPVNFIKYAGATFNSLDTFSHHVNGFLWKRAILKN